MTIEGKTSEECYPLSLKDMCTIERIPEFIRAGIDSFKIEGRMKKPEYVAGVTSIYRKYIDKYYEDEKASEREWKIEEEDLLTLSSLYIRTGIQEGYYHKHNGREMVTLDSPAYKQNDEKMLLALREKYLTERKKFPVSISASFRVGSPARLSMNCLGTVIEVTGETVQKASKTPVSKGELEERVSKLGETNFIPGEISIDADADIFYPVGKLNALRRETCEALQEAIILQNGFQNRMVCGPKQQMPAGSALNYKSEKEEKDKTCECAVSVRTYDQLEAVSDFHFYSRIYLDGDLFLQKSGQLTSLLAEFHDRGVEIVLSLPYILRKRDEKDLEKLYELFQKSDYMTGIQIRSLEGAGFLFKKNYSKKLFTDAGFYIWNKEAAKVFSDLYRVTKFCLPYELNSAGQCRLAESIPCEKVVYGRIPMMLTANCIAKTSGNCVHGKEAQAFLTDRYQVRFPVLLDCVHCMNIIYNSVPLSLHGKVKEAIKTTDIRLDFTLENAKECRRVMTFFGGLITGDKNDIKPPYQEYTTGHEKRGVE